MILNQSVWEDTKTFFRSVCNLCVCVCVCLYVRLFEGVCFVCVRVCVFSEFLRLSDCAIQM